MWLMTHEGTVGLYGVRWRGHSMKSGVSLGKLSPREALFGSSTAAIDAPLNLDEVRSSIDGITDWTRLSAISYMPETGNDGLTSGLTVNVRATESESWQQGDATLQFRSDWRSTLQRGTEESGLKVHNGVILSSRFPSERPFSDHLQEQRKVLNLITLLSGKPVHFRRHKVSSQDIVTYSVGGTVLGRPKADLISAETVRDVSQPQPSVDEFKSFLAQFPEIGGSGMERWANCHDDWKRYVLPAVGILGRRGAFIEDVIVSLSMSIEAAGQLLGPVDGEKQTYARGRATTATNVYRCFETLRLDRGDIAPSSVALSRAIANTYNDIKHFDRGEFPDPDVSHLVSVLVRYIVRCLPLHIIDPSDGLLDSARGDKALFRLHGLREDLGISFDESGKVQRTRTTE